MKKWHSAFSLVTNYKSYLRNHYFHLESPSITFCLTFVLTSLRKGYFLYWRLRRYRLLMAEIAVLMVFDIRLQASSRISMQNRFVYDEYNFSSIMLTFFYWNIATENVSATSKAYMGDSGSTLCSIVIAIPVCFKAFQYIWICQWNAGFYTKHLLHWHSRRLKTPLSWNSCIAKNVWIFHTVFYSFYGEKVLLTECSNIWSSSP